MRFSLRIGMVWLIGPLALREGRSPGEMWTPGGARKKNSFWGPCFFGEGTILVMKVSSLEGVR